MFSENSDQHAHSQADSSLCWTHESGDTFSDIVAQILKNIYGYTNETVY